MNGQPQDFLTTWVTGERSWDLRTQMDPSGRLEERFLTRVTERMELQFKKMTTPPVSSGTSIKETALTLVLTSLFPPVCLSPGAFISLLGCSSTSRSSYHTLSPSLLFLLSLLEDSLDLLLPLINSTSLSSDCSGGGQCHPTIQCRERVPPSILPEPSGASGPLL